MACPRARGARGAGGQRGPRAHRFSHRRRTTGPGVSNRAPHAGRVAPSDPPLPLVLPPIPICIAIRIREGRRRARGGGTHYDKRNIYTLKHISLTFPKERRFIVIHHRRSNDEDETRHHVNKGLRSLHLLNTSTQTSGFANPSLNVNMELLRCIWNQHCDAVQVASSQQTVRIGNIMTRVSKLSQRRKLCDSNNKS